MKIPLAKLVFDEEMKDAALDALQSERSVLGRVFSGNNAVEDHLGSMVGWCWGGRAVRRRAAVDTRRNPLYAGSNPAPSSKLVDFGHEFS